MLEDSHSILNRWKLSLCQLVNVYMVNEVKLTAVRTAETLELTLVISRMIWLLKTF